MTFDQAFFILILAGFLVGCFLIFEAIRSVHRIGAGGPAEQEHVGAPKTTGTDGEIGTDTHGLRGTKAHGLSICHAESTRGSLPDNQEGRHGGRERGGSATNCGTRAAPHHDPRVTILARSRPYDQENLARPASNAPAVGRHGLKSSGTGGPSATHRAAQDDAA